MKKDELHVIPLRSNLNLMTSFKQALSEYVRMAFISRDYLQQDIEIADLETVDHALSGEPFIIRIKNPSTDLTDILDKQVNVSDSSTKYNEKLSCVEIKISGRATEITGNYESRGEGIQTSIILPDEIENYKCLTNNTEIFSAIFTEIANKITIKTA